MKTDLISILSLNNVVLCRICLHYVIKYIVLVFELENVALNTLFLSRICLHFGIDYVVLSRICLHFGTE